MRILQVNQYYYPRGGADKYFLELSAALQAAGEEVAVFSMEHPRNLATIWSKYFISRLSFNEGQVIDRLKTPGRVLYSLETKKKFTKLVKDFKPEVIHIHNIYHHLSPSLLDVAAKFKIPVVMHLHDYKLICPNHTLFTKGAYCERCQGGRYYQCLKNRCVKNSILGSALAMIEMYFHHNLLKIYENRVTKFIAPSQFMKETVTRFGQDPQKIVTIYNPFNIEPSANQTDLPAKTSDSYFLYFGRLSEEKGLRTLVKAAALSGQKIKLAGIGPLKDELQRLAEFKKAPVEFLGFQEGNKLVNLITSAQAVIIPSVWAENMPLSLLEALSLGKIVIASRIGGLPEIVKEAYNGWLFEPNNEDDLASKMKLANSLTTDKYQQMTQAAQSSVAQLTLKNHLEKIVNLYHQIITTSKN